MKKVKMILAAVLLCAVSFAGYSVNNYFTTPAEKLMNANVQALTRSEGGSGGGYSCTVTTQCSAIFPNSTISCTGVSSCKRGLDMLRGAYVECDGNKTYC